MPSAAVELVLGVTKLMDIAGVALDSLGAMASAVIVADGQSGTYNEK